MVLPYLAELRSFLFHQRFEFVSALHARPESGCRSEKLREPDRRIDVAVWIANT